jgi:hypothetical protein
MIHAGELAAFQALPAIRAAIEAKSTQLEAEK